MPIPLGVLAVAGAGATTTGSFDLIETQTLASATTTVTFSNVNTYTQYKHLQLRVNHKSTGGTNFVELRIRINGDTSSSYWAHWLEGQGSTAASSNAGVNTSIYAGVVQGATAPSSNFTGSIIDIFDFQNASKTKTIKSYNGGTNASVSTVYFSSGLYTIAAAVSSISLFCSTGNFTANSKFSLYGVK